MLLIAGEYLDSDGSRDSSLIHMCKGAREYPESMDSIPYPTRISGLHIFYVRVRAYGSVCTRLSLSQITETTAPDPKP